MAVVREISSPKLGFMCVIVFYMYFVHQLLNNIYRLANKRLVPVSTHFSRDQIREGRTISSQSVYSHLKIVPNEALLYTTDNVTAANVRHFNFWKRIDAMITNDSLYLEDFNVSLGLNVLRHAKIVKADLFLERTSYKWNLLLLGGQRVVFKPKIV